jgi:GT2 family glycosyltransferase
MLNQGVASARVAIVLVNWNGWRECVECIDSVFAQLHRNFQVFVVDNASNDRSLENIASWCSAPSADPAWRRHPGVRRLTDQPNVHGPAVRLAEHGDRAPPASGPCQLTLIRSGVNRGFAGGCNLAINTAGPEDFDYFWFLNADTVVDEYALVELLNRAYGYPDIGIVGSTLRYYDRPGVVQAMGGAVLDRSDGGSRHIGEGALSGLVPVDASAVEREMTYVVGASMLVSTRFIAEIGLMEEDYFLYYEEIDWALRGRDKFVLGYAPRSFVFHKSGANSAKVLPLFSAGYYYRNRLRFVARFLPGRLAAAKRSLLEQMLRHIARGRWGHARIVLTTLLAADRITANVTRSP